MANIRRTLQAEWASFMSLVRFSRSQSPFAPPQSDSEETPLNQMPGGFQRDRAPEEPAVNTASVQMNMFDMMMQFVVSTLFLIVFVPVYIIYRLSVVIVFFMAAVISRLQGIGTQFSSSDPKDISRRFAMDLDDRLRKVSVNDIENQVQLNRPQFLECSYSEAIGKVKGELRWLLLYIESPHSLECAKFSQTVLTNESVLEFINSNNVCVWGGDITKSEAFQVSNQFNITKLPFLGLLCMTRQQIPTSSGTQQSHPMISLVMRIQGLKDPSHVYKKLTRAYNKYNAGVNSIRLEYGINPSTQDRSRSHAGTSTQIYEQWLKWRTSKLSEHTSETSARIAIKFPDGKRHEISLPSDSSVEEIYAYIECKFNNNVILIPGGIYTEPVGYNHHYDFSLLASFPERELLRPSDSRPLSEIPAIYPNGSLMVEFN